MTLRCLFSFRYTHERNRLSTVIENGKLNFILNLLMASYGFVLTSCLTLDHTPMYRLLEGFS